VTVIGAGWAGLAASLELAAAGVSVTLFEAARQAGGRARAVQVRGETLDNGQHLLLGACHELLRLLALIGVDEPSVLQRKRLDLPMHHRDGRRLRIGAAALPAPWHLAVGLVKARGLPLGARLQALAGWPRLRAATGAAGAAPELTVSELLRQAGQPDQLVELLWEPLCLAIMNTRAQVAAAIPFLKALLEAFDGPPSNADLLLPRNSLDAVFATPALGFLSRHGARMQTGRRVDAIETCDGRVIGLRYGGELHSTTQIVLATSPRSTARLLPSAGLERLATDLAALEENAISTIYLRLASNQGVPGTLLTGLLGTTSQWCFDRHSARSDGLLSVVVSDDPCSESGPDLARRVCREIAGFWPALKIEDAITLRERRATLRATPRNEALRPPTRTGVTGLWLAGDYTRTGLPATLEGAIRSGVAAARLAIAAG
jgi:squalene-associated FAD-dependent desaturase